jgi:hypothetical protein
MRSYWAAVLCVCLAFPAASDSGTYIGGGSAPVSGDRIGVIACQQTAANPTDFGLGGVCSLDCGGFNDDCTVTNSNGFESYNVCWDNNGDGIDETCVGPCTGACSTGGFKGQVNVYVKVGGTTGDISTFDP